MAARVDTAEVKEIIATALDNLTAFIMPANMLVNELLLDKGFDEARLTEIERWLAAHLVAIRDPRMTERSLENSRQGYEAPRIGQHLNGTRYGQMAIMLDTSRTLAALADQTAIKRAKLTLL